MGSRAFGSQISRRRLLGYAGVGSVGLVSAALIGCSSSAKTPAGDASAPVNAAKPTTAQPKSGGVWRSLIINEPTNIDIVIEPTGNVQPSHNPVYSRLLMWKSGPGVVPSSILQGDAVNSWETTDGRTWTFKLRENLKFHPKPPLNGRVADSEDVKTSFDRFIAKSPARKNIQDLVERVEAPDKGTVVFRLKESYPAFAEILTGSLGLFVYSKEANAGQLETQKIEGAIGTGPWMWKSRQPSVAIEYERHPEWHIKDEQGRQLPYLAGWRALIIPEYAQGIAQFAAGQLSTFVPKTEDAAGLLDRVPKAQIVAEPPPDGHSFYAFHQETASNVMRDVRLRRAWSMAIDRKSLMEVFGQFEKAKKLGYTLNGPIGNPPIPADNGMKYWWLDPFSEKQGPSRKWFEYNTAEAKKLVQAAGYDGRKIVVHSPSPAWLPTGEAQVPMLKEAGFNPQLNVMEYSQYVGGPYSGKGMWEAAYGNMSAFPTLDETLVNLMVPGGLRNMPALSDKVPDYSKVGELIAKQRKESNKEARREIVYDIQRLSADQMWYVPSINNRWGTLSFAQANARNYGQYQGSQVPSETMPYYWLDS